MRLNPSTTRCAPWQLTEYLTGTLSTSQMLAVETHLSTCRDCSEQLEQQAGTPLAWSQLPGMLDFDSFDQQSQQAADDASMLTREIRGWLDPTDDPQMLGRFAGYEIAGVIGHGGMGIVLKGFEPALNRFVAIKAMAPRLASSEAARKRFAREARATAAVIHENVIAIHRVDSTHGLPFLVMPYWGGESLQRRIDKVGALGLEASLQIASQIAAGLAAAHARGLIHRDIKPSNILLQPGVQRITITDFGLARAADDGSLTRTGIIAGTPPYMSPEQARARPLDARSDLFSLGSVLYVMLTGKTPFQGATNYETIEGVATDSATPIEIIDPTLPSWVVALVRWLHEKSAAHRPGSASEVQQIIDACLSHIQNDRQSLPEALLKRTALRPWKRMWKAAVVATIGVCLTAIILLMYDDPQSTTPPAAIHANETRVSIPAERKPFTLEAFDSQMKEIESVLTDLEQSIP